MNARELSVWVACGIAFVTGRILADRVSMSARRWRRRADMVAVLSATAIVCWTVAECSGGCCR